jgi:phenylacetate-CoA ligase
MYKFIYDNLPISFQNLACSIYGRSVKRVRYSEEFKEYFEFLKISEFWNETEIENYKNNKFLELVNYCQENIPFYKTWFGDHGIDVNKIQSLDDIELLPILTKDVVKENIKYFKSNDLKSSSLNYISTSGTTGLPLKVAFQSKSIAFQWAIWWRHKFRFGLKPGDRHLSLTGAQFVPINQSSPPYWRFDNPNNRILLSSYHINQNTIGDIVRFLNKNHFKFYTGSASALYNLFLNIKEAQLPLLNKPDVLVTGADALLPSYKELFTEFFGINFTEQYGMVEFAGNMSKCEENNFHEDFECGHIEAISDPYSDSKKLVLTGWGNLAMPFIRYAVGDLGQFSNEKCGCGRKSAVLSDIEGRNEDYIVTPNGNLVMGMNQVFKFSNGINMAQIFQFRNHDLEIRLVPNKYFSEDDKHLILRSIRERIGSEVNIQFKLVDSIEKSTNGKFKAVISEIKLN